MVVVSTAVAGASMEGWGASMEGWAASAGAVLEAVFAAALGAAALGAAAFAAALEAFVAPVLGASAADLTAAGGAAAGGAPAGIAGDGAGEVPGPGGAQDWVGDGVIRIMETPTILTGVIRTQILPRTPM